MMKSVAAALLLLLGVASVSGQSNGYTIGGGPLDTTGSSFYGFYGFYGFVGGPPNPLFCDVVEVKFTLYNYGSADLTSINTIQYIIDQTKEAIALTFKEVAPTSSDEDYVATVTELDGSAVTFVTVTAEINFQDGAIDDITAARALGGQFASGCGVTEADNESGVETILSPSAPTSGVCSLGFDLVVRGYQQDVLQNDESEMVAFQTAMQSSFQSAISLSTGDDKAAAAATIELIGITDAYSNGVAVRMYLHFAEGEDTCKDFEGKLMADSYSMGNKFGILEGRIKVVETVDVTDETDRRRSLLQNGAVGSAAARAIGETAEKNLLSVNVAKAGLGVNSIEPGSAECRIVDGLVGSDSTGEGSSDGAYGTSDGPATSDSGNSGPNVSTEYGGAAGGGAAGGGAAGGGAAGGGAAGDSGFDSAKFHSFYGFYGSSDDSSFYGIYGVSDAASAAAHASSGAADGSSGGGEYSSAMGTSFYGYTDSAPSGPSSSPSTPSKPSPSTPYAPKPPSTPPATPATYYYPVYFSTFLSDYTMEDLAGTEDMAQFKADYVAAVDNAIKLLGVTSGPSVETLDVYAASVAVDTLVTFVNDAAGADLLMQVLAQNPSLAFPAFSSLGSVTITDVRNTPGDDLMAMGQATPGPSTCSQQGILDKSGECCLAPASLDAEMNCCFEQVDECGVCGGSGQSCALSAIVRVSTPATPALQDKSSPEFAAFVADFKDGLSTLFSSYGVNPSNVEVDEAGILSTTDANGDLIMDIGFKFYPAANGATIPTVSQAQGILKNAADASMTHKDITLLEVLQVGRSGVCGNGFCEVGEMLPLDQSSGDGLCSADCPGVLTSCPVGAQDALVGDKYESCSGNGGCALATGKCNCDDGYTGDNCGACAEGFTAANGACHSAVAGVETRAADSEGSDTTSIVLGVVFGVIALIVIALAVYWLLVLRKRRDASREEGLAFSSQAQVPAANEEPEVPSRQVVENTV